LSAEEEHPRKSTSEVQFGPDRLPLAKALVFTALAAILIRFLYFFEHSGTAGFAVPLLDQKYYHLFAQAIADGEDLRRFGGFRPILYPLFLSFFYKTLGGAGSIAAVFAQHVLGTITALMAASIAYILSNRRGVAALAAGLLYAMAAPPLFYEGELLIATMMAFLCAAQLLLIAIAAQKPWKAAWPWWAAAGLAAALAAQARPNILLFFPVYALVGGVVAWRNRSPGPLVILAALPVILAVQAGFGFVNQWQSGRYQFVTSAGGINFYVGNNARADGMIPRAAFSTTYKGEYRDSIAAFAEVGYRRAMAERGLEPSSDPGEISRFWYRETFRDIQEDPGRWAGLMLKKTLLVLGNYEIPNGESFTFSAREESWLLKLSPVRWALLLALVPAGLWLAWRSGNRLLLSFLLLFLCLYAASFILFFVNSRFRIPLWPGACVLAGCGVSYLVELGRAARWSEFVKPAAAGAVLGIFSLALAGLAGGEDFSRPYYFRSLANYEIGQYDAAKADILKSIELKPATGDIAMHHGNVEFQRGNYQEAISIYQHALELEPGEPRTFNNIGAAHEELGQMQDAYEAYLAALDLVPDHQTALVNAALLELRAGYTERAAEHIDRAMEAPSTGYEEGLLAARAFLASQRGDKEKANELLNQAAEINEAATERFVEDYRNKIELVISSD